VMSFTNEEEFIEDAYRALKLNSLFTLTHVKTGITLHGNPNSKSKD